VSDNRRHECTNKRSEPNPFIDPPASDELRLGEPRHPSWFTSAAESALRGAAVSRVVADPVRCPRAEAPGGVRRFAYFRWHGSPRLYCSKYSDAQLAIFAATVRKANARDTWCIFDNTARHAAWDDALQFSNALRALPDN
jgi:uncharacterized protein YecE (DUF72 family)